MQENSNLTEEKQNIISENTTHITLGDKKKLLFSHATDR